MCSNNTQTEGFDTCNNVSSAEGQIAELGDTAAEACSRISTEADNIRAHYEGSARNIDSLLGPFSPNNWSSGDNQTDDIITNIVNNNLSECEILKIENDCKNSVATSQINSISNVNCPACSDPKILEINPNICSVSDVTQTNVSEINQTCTIQSAIETLLQKTNSVESQALAEVLQEASGLLSGDNTYKSDNCTLINTDMSSAQYIENRSACANEISVNQENKLEVCGQVTGVLQQNQFNGLQSCLIQSEAVSESSRDSDTVAKSESTIDQSTDTNISGISLTICLICLILLSCLFVIEGGKTSRDKNVLDTVVKMK